jgi:hypothetical protein
MKKTVEEVNDSFYEKVKGDFEHLSKEQIKEASTYHFKVLKMNMANNLFDDFHFKYFGKFIIYPKKVIGTLIKLKNQKLLGKISTQEFLEKEKKYNMIIKKHEKENN